VCIFVRVDHINTHTAGTVMMQLIKAFHIKYCKIPNKVTQDGKKQDHNRFISTSDNKIKSNIDYN